jgi:alginate O-acetyltransferase complex protein AlgI
MSFISLQFYIFFLIVFLIYFLLKYKQQNVFLLIVSYIFYAYWDWRFSFLLLIPTVTDYFCGLMIEKCKEQKEKRRYLTLSLTVNLSVLVFFKSFNFFIAQLCHLLAGLGFNAHMLHLEIILPLGISFYTFKSLSYTIDIYRGCLKPVEKFFDYALFISFFPSLLAGPIERATNFIPQIQKKRTVSWDNIRLGLYLIYWGVFKKVFIADNCARMAQDILIHPLDWSGGEILVALYSAAFRLYCDISGYTDIARGIAKCMGFELSINFQLPYLARNISEYWRKWHMSMTYWFRDYVFFPLLVYTKGNAYFSSFITLLCISLWHSISLSSIWRGIYYGLAVSVYQLYKQLYKKNKPTFGLDGGNKIKQALVSAVSRIVTFHIVCIGGLFFYNLELRKIAELLIRILFNFKISGFITSFWLLFICIWMLVLVELLQAIYNDEFIILKVSIFFRLIIYWLIFWCIFGGGGGLSRPFIYFGF